MDPLARRPLLSLLTGIALAAGSASCTWANQAQPWVSAGPSPLNYLPDWSRESTAGLRQALLAQCKVAKRLGPPWPVMCGELAGLAAPASNGEADPTLRQWISERFDAWAVTAPNGAARGLLTGYYEPRLTGSLRRQSAHQTPIYAPPAGLTAGTPFASRAEIVALSDGSAEADNAATAALKGREIVWVDDPVDAFFLHIQGSGRVQLRNGDELRVGYAGNNGHPYFAIGRALIENGAISRDAMSAQAIRRWLTENPAQAQALMNRNARYIFFRAAGISAAIDKQDFVGGKQDLSTPGPVGSLGVALTPGRSLATDPSFLPAGTLLYLTTRSRHDARATPVGRLAVSQDTGSAIRGAVRADLFTGTGAKAGIAAGALREPLQMWLLWPRGHHPAGKLPFARVDLSD